MSACVVETATGLVDPVTTTAVWLGVFGLGLVARRSGTERCDVVLVNNSIRSTPISVERLSIYGKH